MVKTGRNAISNLFFSRSSQYETRDGNDRLSRITTVIGLIFVWPLFRGSFMGPVTSYGATDNGVPDVFMYYVLFVFCAGLITVLVLLKIGDRRLLAATSSVIISVCVGILMLFAAALTDLANDHPDLSTFFLIASACLNSVGFIGIIVFWSYRLAQYTASSIFAYFLLSLLLSAPLGLAIELLPSPICDRLYAVLAVIAMFFLAILPTKKVQADTVNHPINVGNAMRFLGLGVCIVLLTAIMRGYISVDGSGFTTTDYLYSRTLICALCVATLIGQQIRKDRYRYFVAAWIVVGVISTIGLLGMSLLPSELTVIFKTMVTSSRVYLNLLIWLMVVLLIRSDEAPVVEVVSIFVGIQFFSALVIQYFVPAFATLEHLNTDTIAFFSLIVFAAIIAIELNRLELRRVDRMETAIVSVTDKRVEAIDGIVRSYRLTQREKEVLALLSDGISRKAMAEKLVVEESTIKAHVGSIYRKLDCHCKDEIIQFVKDAEAEIQTAGE